MRGDEARDAGALLGTALDEVAELTRDVHRAIAGRVFGLMGTAGAPAKVLHDGIATVAYESTRLGVRALPSALGSLAQLQLPPSAASVHDDPRGRFALGALAGFWGDRMAEQRPTLAPAFTLRAHGQRLRRVPANVVADLGERAGERVVVFLHGLCESDLSWSFRAERTWGDRTVTYGSLLREDAGWTPLYAYYNTGRHISDNGAELAEMLEELTRLWPVPVREIALVGHSMGGLVARSAAHQGSEAGLAWVASLRHLIGLGAPHLGAPLERAVNRGTRAMATLPETRPFARWLNRRSVGIKDLRHGAVVRTDWDGFDPEDAHDHCGDLEFLADVAYYAVSATLSKAAPGRLPFFGDLLVDHASATGRGPARVLAFEVERVVHLGGKHHFHLLGDATVYEHLRSWLAGR